MMKEVMGRCSLLAMILLSGCEVHGVVRGEYNGTFPLDSHAVMLTAGPEADFAIGEVGMRAGIFLGPALLESPSESKTGLDVVPRLQAFFGEKAYCLAEVDFTVYDGEEPTTFVFLLFERRF